MRNTIIFIIAIITLSSCTKEIKLKEEYITPKLVGYCVFNTDSTWKLKLNKSAAIYGNDKIEDINDANVSILDENGTLVEVLSNKGNGIYSSEMSKPEADKKYTISIESNNFASIKATSFIPKDFTLKIDTLTAKRNETEFLDYTLEIEDDPNTQNYYIIEGYKGYFYSQEDYYYSPDWLRTKDINIERAFESLDAEYESPLLFLRDDNFNGLTYKLKVSSQIEDWWAVGENSEVGEAKVHAQIIVYSVPEAYFLYLLSIEKFSNNRNDPFSTPIKVYSNFDKGLGIFAGVNSQLKEFDITEKTSSK